MLTSRSAPRRKRFSAEPLRGYAAVLALSLWVVAAWSLATPGRLDRNGTLKGTDFVSTWLPGHIVAHGPVAALYDRKWWRAAFPRLFPDVPGLLYLPNYPPQAALLFSPLGRWPFESALIFWTMVSVALYSGSVYALWRRCPSLSVDGATVALIAAGWPAFYLLVLNGQNTTIVLACYTAAALACVAGREWWMGAAFGLCAIKPHFLAAPALALLLAGRWRAVAGICTSVAVQVGVTAAVLGPAVFVTYGAVSLELLRDPAIFEPKLWQAHGLKNATNLMLGRGTAAAVVFLVSAGLVLWLAVRAWGKGPSSPAPIRFAILVVASALLNLHLYGYDLVVLAPALLFAADWCVAHPDLPAARRLAWLTAAIVLVPLLAPLAAFTRVQLSVPLMAWFGWELLALTEDRGRPTASR